MQSRSKVHIMKKSSFFFLILLHESPVIFKSVSVLLSGLNVIKKYSGRDVWSGKAGEAVPHLNPPHLPS